MKKRLKIYYLLLAVFLFLFNSCSSDDDKGNPETEVTINEILAAITNNGESKTWKIDSARFTNSTVSNLDVTNAFNIKEDEFVFSASNQTLALEHKQRNHFNKDATDFQTFLLDDYRASVSQSFVSDTDTGYPISFTSSDGQLNLLYIEDNHILAEWSLDANSTLSFKLIEKNAGDYETPTTNLTFTELATIPQEFVFLESFASADMIASHADNSLYLVYSTSVENPDGGNPRAEGVIRYDLSSNTFNNNFYHNADFFTKRSCLDATGLNVSGSQFYNTYSDLGISSNPEQTVNYNDLLDNYFLRHDIVSYDGDTFLIGGNPMHQGEPDPFESILKYNPNTETLTEIATLPSPKSRAASEVVDNKIYTFSGTYSFSESETAETLSYIYDIDSNTFESFDIPVALGCSFTTSTENLIYVAGQVLTLDPDTNGITDRNAYIGAYNTETNEFTQLTHNLEDSDQLSRISGMATINDKLYVVYQNSNDANNENYVIMVADL